MKKTLFGILALVALSKLHAAELQPADSTSNPPPAPPSPQQVWADYDPNKGDFKEQIVKEETRDGFYYRESYISAYVVGEEIRVYCLYKVKAGARNAPGLLNVRGWMGFPVIDDDFVADGWAEMSYDYCGDTKGRPNFTKYPATLKHGNMDAKFGGAIDSETPDKKSITDPRQTSLYIWYALSRRVLSYLEQQKEVDKARIGAKGYSYGGTVMWQLATDPRVKAVVAYFGIGWLDYYRTKSVWMYNNPYVEPLKTPGEEICLAGIAPEAYVPHITAATLFLNGSNDHHGTFERGLESFKRFKPGVPWAYAIQARGHHNTDKTEQDCKMWLEKYVLNKDVFWPVQPKSEIRLNADGIPELVVTPASQGRIKSVEMWYAQKNPCYFTRAWRDVVCVKQGDSWVGLMPVKNVDDYVFGFANINYDTTVVVTTDFNAAIPSKLGRAKASDKSSDVYSGDGGMGAWNNVVETDGVGGIKGFRCTDNTVGTGTELMSDPKWKAAPTAQLGFKFYCTEPQTLIFSGDDYDAVVQIPASDNWQEMVIPASKFINPANQHKMGSWKTIAALHLKPKTGSDITKVVFAQFKWVVPNKPAGGKKTAGK